MIERTRSFRATLCAVLLVAVTLLFRLPVASAQLNQNCVVSVLNRTVQVNADGTWVLPNIPANFGPVRARATCVNNGVTTFGQSPYFTIPANDSANVPPILLGSASPIPLAVTVTAPSAMLTSVGGTTQLDVMAQYGTGDPQDVTAASAGTLYNISNPAIATVGVNGLVTAVSSGTAVIQAVNEGRQGIVTLQIVLAGVSHGGIPDSWAIAHGLDPNDPALASEDPDHDGLTNLQEFQAGTDPNNADTDGDGLTDGQEVLMYHTNAALFSTDGTGISDGIEVRTGTLNAPLSTKLHDAIQSLSVAPSHFVLDVNSIQGVASQQLAVTALLIDGKTTIDLTSTILGTNYSSSDLTICNFGTPDGNIFAGNNGSCTISITNNGFSATATGVVNTFTPTALSFVAIPGFANEVAVNGDYAFVAAGASGLQVVNVSDRNNPSVVAALALAGNANDVKLIGTLAYVASGTAGLQVVDVSVPTAPVLLGTFGTAGNALTVTVRGTLAYIANGSTLILADITNPASISQVGSITVNGSLYGTAVDTTRNLLVAAAGTSGIFVIDVSHPTAPVLLGTVNTGDARAVAIKGNYAFVADYVNSTTSVDITNPAAPVVLSNITDPNLGGFLQDIALSNTFALAADVKFVNGIPITDISHPSALVAREILNFTQRDDNGMGIAIDGTYAYLVTEHENLTKFGTTGDSRLYIGQYLSLVDNKGIAPTASITAPVTGSQVVRGSTIPIIVNASDDVAVAAVNFLVNGQTVFTATAVPYQFNYLVPAGATSITFGANAVDLGGNVGNAATVTVTGIPDPGTTITGIVVDGNHNPVVGATVTAPGGLTATTQSGGTFSIAHAPTVTGSIIVDATDTVGGVQLRGSSFAIPAVRGGTTNVGTIVISQAVFQTNFGTLIAQCDDCVSQQTLPFPFTYFGQTYTSIFVSNNGNIGFNFADGTYTPTVPGFANQPRIGAFWDDLIVGGGATAGAGLYINNTIAGQFVITWLHQQIFCCTGDDTIQLTLFADGRFQFAYNGITTIAGSTSSGVIVGVTPGPNTPEAEVDYIHDPSFSITGLGSIVELFSATNPFNLDGAFILFAPNTSGGYDVQLIPPSSMSAGAGGSSGGTGTAQARAANSGTRALSASQAAAQTSTLFTLQGTVYDASGKPLAGVEVDVTSSRAIAFKGVATTDHAGHYSVTGVPAGGINVVAVSGGKTLSTGGAVVPQNAATATIDLHPWSGRIKTAPVSSLIPAAYPGSAVASSSVASGREAAQIATNPIGTGYGAN